MTNNNVEKSLKGIQRYYTVPIKVLTVITITSNQKTPAPSTF